MCCCDKPTINGEIGYRWQPHECESVFPVNPPDMEDGDELLYDEPGRCGGVDCHSHHYRVVRHGPSIHLLVRHGGRDERMTLSSNPALLNVLSVAIADRYWILHAIYQAYSNGQRIGRVAEDQRWAQAAAEKRIRTRKVRGKDNVRVWIDWKKRESVSGVL